VRGLQAQLGKRLAQHMRLWTEVGFKSDGESDDKKRRTAFLRMQSGRCPASRSLSKLKPEGFLSRSEYGSSDFHEGERMTVKQITILVRRVLKKALDFGVDTLKHAIAILLAHGLIYLVVAIISILPFRLNVPLDPIMPRAHASLVNCSSRLA
jgi:hypothetical protein